MTAHTLELGQSSHWRASDMTHDYEMMWAGGEADEAAAEAQQASDDADHEAAAEVHREQAAEHEREARRR